MRSISRGLLHLERKTNGNVLIGFLIFLPILLSSLALLSTSSFYLKEKTKTLSICRQYLLEVQGQMSIALEKLENLNPLAKQLRVQRKNLEYLLSISDIASKPLILVKLARVTARQIKLSIQQKFIIKKAEGYAARHLRLLKSKIYGSKKTLISSSKVPAVAKLAVVAVPSTSLSPSYKVAWNFTQKQSINVTWIEKPAQVIPLFLRFFVKGIPPVNGSCKSTLRKSAGNVLRLGLEKFIKVGEGGLRWQPVLLQGRVF